MSMNGIIPQAIPADEDADADSYLTEWHLAAVRRRLQLEIEAMPMSKLRVEAHCRGGLMYNPLLTDAASLRAALLQETLQEFETNEDSPDVVDAWLRCTADPWPEAEQRAPPRDDAEALDPDGPWSLAACGAEVRLCFDDPGKGRGAFATRAMTAGRVVGVYAGERLTQRQHALRHTRRGPLFVPPTAKEDEAVAERRARLAELSEADGAPMGGSDNHGGYTFTLLPDAQAQNFPGRCAFLDAEDPRRSAWPRYFRAALSPSTHCTVSRMMVLPSPRTG